MEIESLTMYIPVCGLITTFLVGLASVDFLMLKRMIRAYSGDQGVDVLATIIFLLITMMMFGCIGGLWVASRAPD